LPIDGGFDSDLANALAEMESYNKHLYRPNTYLHKWWARRCGSTFRLILKHLVEDQHQRDYYSSGGLAGKIVLDPMMGGGTTLHEAIRLEANVIGADIDPIPILQARASLTDMPFAEMESAFAQFYADLYAAVGGFFITSCPSCNQSADLQFTLYGLHRYCQCGPAIFVDSLTLRYESDNTVVKLCSKCHKISRTSVDTEEPCACQETNKPPLVEKGTLRCSVCNGLYKEDLLRPLYARYTPLAVVGRCPQHGQFFRSPSDADLELIENADDMRSGLDFGLPADFDIVPGPKSSDLINHGVQRYLDLFSSRQLLYLHKAIALLPTFKPNVRLNLALLVSTSLEFNSMLCGYKGGDKKRPGAIRHTFSHHAYSFPHTALENNPMYPAKVSGTLENLFDDRIRRARKWASLPQERWVNNGSSQVVSLAGEVDAGTEVQNAIELRSGIRKFKLLQGSSASLDLDDDSVDYVVTDPPYFDSVQYSDLAAFFRVWLKRLVPDAAPWDYDLADSAVDPQANGRGQYTDVLGKIFAESHRVLRKDHGRLIFTFHHWNPKGWAALTMALKHGGFVLLNRYVVHSENPVSVHIVNLKALIHDAVLVLAPIEAGLRRFWQQPTKVDKSESAQFCADCADALGWMLNVDLTDAEIESLWRKLLE
jgi:adenine-specific DNA methylase